MVAPKPKARSLVYVALRFEIWNYGHFAYNTHCLLVILPETFRLRGTLPMGLFTFWRVCLLFGHLPTRLFAI